MREIRPSGSEGGGAFRSPYPYQSPLGPDVRVITSMRLACHSRSARNIKRHANILTRKQVPRSGSIDYLYHTACENCRSAKCP